MTQRIRTLPTLLCSLTTGTTGLSLLSLPLSLRALDPICSGAELISMLMLPFSSILSTCNESDLCLLLLFEATKYKLME